MPYFNLMVLGHQNGDVAIKEYRLNNSWPRKSTLPHNYIYTGATEVP
jgi:hypothetical protein